MSTTDAKHLPRQRRTPNFRLTQPTPLSPKVRSRFSPDTNGKVLERAVIRPRSKPHEDNRLRSEDAAAHDWYRFVLSFPAHLVQEYVRRFGLASGATLLDPFCGTGTTLVESKKLGLASVGVEQLPMPAFATRVKVDWNLNPDRFLAHARRVAEQAAAELAKDGIDDSTDLPVFASGRGRTKALRTLPPQTCGLLLRDSISPLPLHKVLVLQEAIRNAPGSRYRDHERLALAKIIVFKASNLRFGPEVGLGSIRQNAPVISEWLKAAEIMAGDLRALSQTPPIGAIVHRADARSLRAVLAPASVDAVITSPPYPNEKDYTRTTRLESVLLGFIPDKASLRLAKEGLVRSNTRGVFKSDSDDAVVADHTEIRRIAEAIERRRIALGKTSGFERLYSRVTKLYFGGMARHLSDLRSILRPGAHLAYVVGDQASYLRVMIRTGQLLADIAQTLGYEVISIDLFRTRMATATREQLREEVLVLRWPGKKRARV